MFSSKDAASIKQVQDSDIRNAVELPDDMETVLGEERRMASFSMEQLRRAGEAEAVQKSMNHLSDQQLKRFSASASATEFADPMIPRTNLQCAILSIVGQLRVGMDDYTNNCTIMETKFAEHYHEAFKEIIYADQGCQKTMKSIAVVMGRSTNASLQLLRGGV